MHRGLAAAQWLRPTSKGQDVVGEQGGLEEPHGDGGDQERRGGCRAGQPAFLRQHCHDWRGLILQGKSFSAYHFFEGTFTSFFKDKKSQKKSQNIRYQGFMLLIFLLDDRMIQIWIRSRIRI